MSEQSNISEEQNHEINLDRRDANQLIPSLESAYYGLIIKGFYLPKISASIITSNYLLNILFGKIFAPQAEQISIGVLLRPVSKFELCQELLNIQLEDDKKWGIDSKHTPDKLWCLNVLKTLKPHHQYFQKHQEFKNDSYKFTSEQLKLIKDLDTTCGKKSCIKRFFQTPKDKKNELQHEKLLQKNKSLEKKLKKRKQLMIEAQQEIEDLHSKLIQPGLQQ